MQGGVSRVIGTKIGNYSVVKQIGEGGMGAVYTAKHTLLDKVVAVKVLLPQYSSNAEVVSRFFNEAKATTMVHHPGIVELYDFGHLDDGRAYIVMELLVGESLDERIDKVKRMPYTEAARIVSRIAGIMQAAHDHDIVHRDLKPENIILVSDPGVEERERPKVLDFGIAKLNDANSLSDKSKIKTQTGSIIGSPLYMSPEQCRGAGRVDYRSDIYSLGCILFELLCGRPPFDGEGTGEIIGAHLHLEAQKPHELVPSIPSGLGEVVLKALSKKPSNRFQSMDDFAIALRKYCTATAGRRTTSDTRPWGQEAMDAPVEDATSASLRRRGKSNEVDRVSEYGRTRTPVPTTLGLSTESGLAPRATQSRKSTILSMLVAASVAAAGVAYYQISKSKDKGSAAAQRESSGVQAAPGDTAEVAMPAPAKVTLHIASTPTGAAIHLASDDSLLGYTPADLSRSKAAGTVELLLRSPGHQESALTLSVESDQETLVTLSPMAAEASEVEEVIDTSAAQDSKAASVQETAARKADARAKTRSVARAEAKAKAEARAEAKAKAKAKAEADAKNSPLTQPKAKTKRNGDGALNPFNM